MPTYEYFCPTCDSAFDYYQSITAEPLSACPHCHQAVQRKISGGGGLIFKGSGFYITDYKKNGGNTEKTDKPNTNKTTEADKTLKGEAPKAADKSSSKEKTTEPPKKSET